MNPKRQAEVAGLNERQVETRAKIEAMAALFGIDPKWAVAIALVESSLGENQKSPTGCKGVFQMSTIAMKDLLLSMETKDDDLVDIACGVAYLRLLLRRWKTVGGATIRFCDPKDRDFYLQRTLEYMEVL